MRKMYNGSGLFKLVALAMLFISINSFGQIPITGTVTDESDEGLPGVNVVVQGTSTGTVTDIDGNYAIEVSYQNASLVFSSVGYITQTILVGTKSVIDVNLEPDITSLEEIVVIGYGTQRKKDLTGSISTVKSDDFQRVPAANPLEAIQGRATGLQITRNSGMPGAGSSVLIRGTQSINGTNSPIYVVDNIITTNIDNISPNDIESVSVMKDASATAIYGSRAANGVIVITTKRGMGAATPQISFNAYGGVQNESNLKLDLLNADQFVEIFTEAHENAGIAPLWTQDDLLQYQGVDVDWLDEVMRTGVIQNYDLGVSGSSGTSNYYLSANYFNNKGMLLGADYNRMTVRFNSDHKIKNFIKFGNSLNVYASNRNGSAGIYDLASKKVPITRVYEDDGDWGIIRNSSLEHMHQNPVWQANEIVDNTKGKGIQGNLYLTLTLLEGLDLTARGNVEYSHNYNTNFSPAINPAWGWEGSTKNLVEKESRQNLHWITDFLLNYSKTFAEDHDLKILAGYSLEENTFENLGGSRSNTPNNEIQFLNAGDPESQLNYNGYSDWAFTSLFGRVNYDYKDKYLFTGTIRRDGTSRLADGNRYGVFPSASVAWRISEENFMGSVGFINDLKLRASWGSVGNVLSISNYGTINTLTQRNFVFNEAPFQGYTLANAVNADLSWESTTKTNFGVDFEMFNNELYSNLDFFIENTDNLLFRQPIPLSTGLSGSPFINAGLVRNTGFEMLLGYRKIVNDWSFDIAVNFTTVKNEVIDLNGRDLRTSGIVEGYPVRSYFGYVANGIIRTQSDLDNNPHEGLKDIGDIWIKDVDGFDADGNLIGEPDGIINSADRTLIGSRYPDFSYGAMLTAGYKNFTLQVQLNGVQGFDKNVYSSSTNGGPWHYYSRWAMNHEASIMDRFHPTKNPDGSMPIVKVSDPGKNTTFSSFWLRDASFLRIQNVNLNYNFPSAILDKLKLNDLGLYISAQNLYTFTSFEGNEVDTGENAWSGVPQATTWTLGLKTSF